jgi:hypothetical protein
MPAWQPTYVPRYTGHAPGVDRRVTRAGGPEYTVVFLAQLSRMHSAEVQVAGYDRSLVLGTAYYKY